MKPILEKLTRRFDEEWRFFKGWIDHPGKVGAVVPTGKVAAVRMASVITPGTDLPVLEVGPGTGVVTREILAGGLPADQLYMVEYSADFAETLRKEFPSTHVIQGDALRLDETLDEARALTFDAVISGVPMLNLDPDARVALMEDFLSRVPVGRPVIQITHGPAAPVPAAEGRFSASRMDIIFRNIPPAHLWLYRKPAS